MTPVPGHKRVEIAPIDTHEKDGKSNTWLAFSIHSAGTHIDAPYHFLPERRTIDEMPLDLFMGPGVKIDLTDKCKPLSAITAEDLSRKSKGLEELLPGSIVFLATGWSDAMYWEADYYFKNPHLTRESALWLVEKKVKMVGLDAPPGRRENPPQGMDSATVHRTFLSNDVMIAENLMNLITLPASGFQVIALPCKVHRGDGAPARVIAIL